MPKRLHLDKADGDWMVKLREKLAKDKDQSDKVAPKAAMMKSTHKERTRMTKAAATSALWDTSDASHRLTLRASADFSADSYRRKDHQEGVVLIIGKHTSEDNVLVQSVVFDREVFGEQSAAKSWWDDHKNDVDKTYRANSGSPLDSKAIREMGGINKRVVAVHAAPESAGSLMSGVGQPNDEQMAMINTYTRSPKTPDQVAVFPVLACNDVVDRDVDQFTTKTVRGFMALEGALSPLGKSFMVGHDYSKLPVGRIFNGEVTKQDDVTWLKLWTYIPKTPQYEAYLENVDFGVYWAVSVGVMLGASTCSIGETHEWGWHPYVCSQMHMKGERYKENGETDNYGQPVPHRTGDLAFRKLEDPTDFYELSQVYLGAQYMAEFDKSIGRSATKGIKAMSTVKGLRTAATLNTKSQVVMLSSEEAAKLPPLFPAQSKASEAAAAGIDIKVGDDGLHTWIDQQGLVWTFSMESEEELCLGRKATAEDDDTTTDAAAALEAFEESVQQLQAAAATSEPDDASTELLEALEGVLTEATEALESEDEARVRELIAGASDDVSTLMETLAVTDKETQVDTGDEDDETVADDDNEEAKLSKRAVMKAATAAKLPSALVENISKATGDNNGLDELLTAVAGHIGDLQKQVDTLTPMAEVGGARIKELRAEAIHWYVVSNKAPGEAKGVSTTRIEKLLDMADGDIELMTELRDQYKENARARFPEAVRRSSFPDNINERSALGEDSPNTVSTEGVKRIHG